MNENELSRIVFDLGLKIHKKLGAGLFESVYEECLFYEINNYGLKVERQKYLPIIYENLLIEKAFKIDLIVENKLILEIKAVDFLNDIHRAQVLTYLKMTGCKLGLLLNFRTDVFKDGIKRVINGII
ncbi:GxxExxY protein [Elizabethkingia meningoseptica]|uniref:GxxExxY protein n=1 Tax=Elizabethkingia meningoseptica TaxID=238 RepID=A0A1T3IRH7_ELIME|nr:MULTISPECIES: GxxExxY protein [Elizabethkingia]AQX12294.1 GxxExxY protein [Elizabethkingia meningoseptica]MBG0513820.1 GxxExxY protein [Elizabethkingia meningoseptica]MCL1676541.1 GxxExxY protein [Elizabethkingia meningoseptica]MCL1687395.1 GxxExxY protein [Elizabethkingia meningoseptica]MDE5436265.1 GxxExxY protein [Elizabethkingia meningoseptica]